MLSPANAKHLQVYYTTEIFSFVCKNNISKKSELMFQNMRSIGFERYAELWYNEHEKQHTLILLEEFFDFLSARIFNI